MNIIIGFFALVSLILFIFGFVTITKKWKNYETNEKIGNVVLLFAIFILFCMMASLIIYPNLISTL